MRVRFPAAILAVAGLLTMNCGGIIDPSQNTVDTFSGAIGVGGCRSHAFTSKSGEFTVKLTALSPVSSTVVLFSWAQGGNSDGSCGGLGLLQQQIGTLNVQALGGQITSGNYSIVIQDYGAFTTTETYTFTVSHP